jgi:hypothetical protein
VRVSQVVLVCNGGACHGMRVSVSSEIGTRVQVEDSKGNPEWYVVLRDGDGLVRLAHDSVQKAMADELCAPEEICALCGSAAERRRVFGKSEFDIDCPRCGYYTIPTSVAQTILFRPRDELAGFIFAIQESNARDKRLAVPEGEEKPLHDWG